LISAPANKVI